MIYLLLWFLQLFPYPGPGRAPVGGGGGGGFVLLDSDSAASTSVSSGATTPAMSCSGTNVGYFAIVSAAENPITTPTVSDSTSLTALTNRGGSNPRVRQFYAAAGSGNSSVTFSCSGTGSTMCSIAAMCFSGAHQTSLFDKEVTGSTNCFDCTASSLTPAESGELIIVGASSFVASATFSVDASFMPSNPLIYLYVASQRYGLLQAYKIKTDATAETPTFSRTSGSVDTGRPMTMAAFREAQ